jgi:hypothetical protein
MYIWQMWEGLWQIGDAEDYWTHVLAIWAVKLILMLLLLGLTLVIIVPTYVFIGARTLLEKKQIEEFSSGRVALGSIPAELAPCLHCGSMASRDIVPCVRCGK